jgi:propanol-preferring alcohol dehydrogenase
VDALRWDEMKAMVLRAPREPLEMMELPVPEPGVGEVLLQVSTCGVCRTDLHVLDGELTEPKLPLVMGHQIVGTVVGMGEGAERFTEGQRVGVPWLGGTCGHCYYCKHAMENLCDDPVFTGYQKDGGYAEYAKAREDYCFPLVEGYGDLEVAPLLCAGLIGYRAYRMTGEAKRIGFYGFGAAGHLLCQVAVFEGREVYAFTKPGDESGQAFARSLGAVWAGGSEEAPPERLDAAIIFAPAGPLVVSALRAVRKGGVVVCAGIHMSDIPAMPYGDLWGERVIRSVANLTRRDGEEFLALAPRVPVKTAVNVYPLEKANEALEDLRAGRFKGSAVLQA